MKYSLEFIEALKTHDIDVIKNVPKADLHNHFVLGGSRDYLKRMTGHDIVAIKEPLHSMDEMHAWNQNNIGDIFHSRKMRELLLEATLVQAKEDGVTVLEIGEDVWALQTYFHNDIEELIDTFRCIHHKTAPDVELRLQIGMSRHCGIEYLMKCLEPFWGRKEFYSIDLYGDELAQPIENFVPIYRKAKECGWRLKAHIGEWGTAEDVIQGIQLLSLDEVQHGIAAAKSEKVMEYLAEHQIRLNITPTSNILLGRVKQIKEHPIGKLYRRGVNVTINSDDILMFDSAVSKEYLRLYESGVLTAEELNKIRLNGLKHLI